MLSSPRQRELKLKVEGHGNGVQNQRILRRQALELGFKHLRAKSFDKFRNMKEDDLDYKTLLELRKLLAEPHNSHVEYSEEEYLKEFTSEINFAIDEYEREQNAHLYSLQRNCVLCGKSQLSVDFCEDCFTASFPTEQL